QLRANPERSLRPPKWPAMSERSESKWRRRELNEETNPPKSYEGNELEKEPLLSGASGECAQNSDCPSVTGSVIPAIVVRAWPILPPHIREAIIVVIDAALTSSRAT